MLAFFPEFHDDELLYSVLARYHLMSGNTSFKHTSLDLFGSDSTCAIVDLPSRLDDLCALIQCQDINADCIIERHTLLPYYASFMTEEKTQAILAAMKRAIGYSIHSLLGTRNTQIKHPHRLRYCSECVKEQESVFGTTFWRRVHQLPGVFICPDHGVFLRNTMVPFSRFNNERLYEVLRPTSADELTVSPQFMERNFQHLDLIARESLWLLRNSNHISNEEQMREFYVSQFEKQNLITIGGRFHFAKFTEMFNDYFGPEFLKFLGCWIYPDSRTTWLHSVLRRPNGLCHPLRQILLLRFLGTSTERFLDPTITRSPGPFGSGPWPCLNKFCHYYWRDVITQCTLTKSKNHKNKIGTFRCSSCGYTYTRSESVCGDVWKYQGRVKKLGAVWMDEFAKQRDSGGTLRGMANHLGVSTTVISRLLRES